MDGLRERLFLIFLLALQLIIEPEFGVDVLFGLRLLIHPFASRHHLLQLGHLGFQFGNRRVGPGEKAASDQDSQHKDPTHEKEETHAPEKDRRGGQLDLVFPVF